MQRIRRSDPYTVGPGNLYRPPSPRPRLVLFQSMNVIISYISTLNNFSFRYGIVKSIHPYGMLQTAVVFEKLTHQDNTSGVETHPEICCSERFNNLHSLSQTFHPFCS